MPEDLQELLDRFEQLVADHGAEDPEAPPDEGVDNFRCDNCVRCANCRFCTACEDCNDCTYCDACLDCDGCTQSRECVGCQGVSHSAHSGYCEGGSHLTLCYDCRDCVQCFACVGLSGAEFHILNVKYARRDYFKKVGELRGQLDALAVQGWFPPWVEVEGDAPSSVSAEPEPVHRSGPADAGTSGPEPADSVENTLSSLLSALEGPEIETEPLDPDAIFGVEQPLGTGSGRFAGLPRSHVEVPNATDVSLDDLDLGPSPVKPKPEPAKPELAKPDAAKSDEPPRRPSFLTRGTRPPRR